MTWWSRLFEQRAEPKTQWTLKELESWSDMGLGDGPTAAGLTITPTLALQVPAVYACCAILSQDIAKTSLKFRKRIGPDVYEDDPGHPLSEILGVLVNPEQTAYDFKRTLMMDLLTHELAFAEIVRAGGRITGLWRLDPCRMRIERNARREKVYRYRLPDGSEQRWTFDSSMPPVLELAHPSPVRQCTELIANSLAMMTYTGKFFANGGRPNGVLKAVGAVSDTQLQRLRTMWEQTHGGAVNSHKPLILEGGMSYDAMAGSNDDAQLTELSQTLRTEIAAVFRIPVWRVGDWSKANFSNMESAERAFVSDALDPYFTCIEESIRRDLLTNRQFNAFSVTFDRASLIRSDTKTLQEALSVGRQNGWYSANDIRRKLGENPLPADAGGDAYLINTALAPIAPVNEETDATT